MEIKTKFSVGDTVHTLTGATIMSHRISEVRVVRSKDRTTVTYLASGNNYAENVLFTSKKDAVALWVNLQGFKCDYLEEKGN